MRHRLLLIFSIGFASGIAVAAVLSVNWILCVLLCCVSLALLVIPNRYIALAVLIAGIAFGCLRYDAFFPPGWSIDRYISLAPVVIVGTVVSEPTQDVNKTVFLLRCSTIKTHTAEYAISAVTLVLVHGAAFQSCANVHSGDKVQVAGLLQHIVPPTNPGQFDWESHLVHRGVSGELVVQRPHGAAVLSDSILFSRYLNWAQNAQKIFETHFSQQLPKDEAGILDGILFGDRSGISPEVTREFAATGTAHILATAGLHVGVLAIVLTALLLRVPIPRSAASLIITLSLWGFALLAGGRPPVVRAVFAATLFYGGRIFTRVPDTPTTIAAAALAILAIAPASLFESDFQLTFVTVTGLLLFTGRWNDFLISVTSELKPIWLRRAADAVGELAGFSTIAQLSSAPLIVYYFGQFSLLSLPANLIVVPILFVIIPCAVFTLALSFLSPAIASVFAMHVMHPLLWLLLHVTEWFAQLPICSMSVAAPAPIIIVVLYVLLFGGGIWLVSDPRRLSAKSHFTRVTV